MSIYDCYTRRNSLIKTLQFKLTPVYGTAEQMAKLGLLDKDRERSQCWPVVLNVLRRIDLKFIADALGNIAACQDAVGHNLEVESGTVRKAAASAASRYGLDWQPLAAAIASGERSEIQRQQGEMRRAVAKLLTKHRDYKSIVNPTKAIKMAAEEAQNDEEAQAVARFARFTTVLVDYFNLKKAFFSHDDRQTTIAYRIVQGNFPIYLANMQQLKQYVAAGVDFEEKFSFNIYTVNGYNSCLVQSQIEVYNRAVGQVNMELQRLYAQRNLPDVLKNVPLKLQMLQRQVLSGGLDMRPATFATYAEMRDAVCAMKDSLPKVFAQLDAAFAANTGPEEPSLEALTENKQAKVAVNSQQELALTYQEKRTAIKESIIKLFFREKDAASILSIKSFLLAVLALRRFIKHILKNGIVISEDVQNMLMQCSNAWELLQAVPNLYKNVRGFLIRKPYKTDKIRMFFDCAAFGKGWDVNKEAAYLLTLFRKDGHYYLGVRRRGAIIDFNSMESQKDEDCYEKMVYKSFDFIKGMPSVLFSKLVLQKFADGAQRVIFDNEQFSEPFELTREDFFQKYYVTDGEARELEDGQVKYLKGYLLKTGDEAGYREAVRQRIELAKRFIKAYKTFAFFDMSQLKPSADYATWTDFTLHVNEFTYGIRWQRIPQTKLQQLVEEGDLFLFKLDNKDFALAANAKAERQDDEQTLLLRELFSPLNAREHVLKLLGDVAIYYRPASMEPKICHAEGSVIVNKIDTNNRPIPPDVHWSLTRYLNGKKEELLPEAAELLEQGLVKWKRSEQNIIKDKRYTEDQMFIHFPVAINYRCVGNDYSFNKEFRALLKGNEEVKLLSVHLGGDNLAEVVIMDQRGKILYQRAYNEFHNYNYALAIALREEERIQAQRSWLQMEKIKNLKLGFMAALVNEVSKLLLAYNAVVILEDFSRGKRLLGGKSVPTFYMQFALNLLHKLNYLVFREREYLAPGGLLNGYQLVPKVESLAGYASQIGCVFFALPSYDMEEEAKPFQAATNLAFKGLLYLERIYRAKKLDKVDFIIRREQWEAFLAEQGLSS